MIASRTDWSVFTSRTSLSERPARNLEISRLRFVIPWTTPSTVRSATASRTSISFCFRIASVFAVDASLADVTSSMISSNSRLTSAFGFFALLGIGFGAAMYRPPLLDSIISETVRFRVQPLHLHHHCYRRRLCQEMPNVNFQGESTEQ